MSNLTTQPGQPPKVVIVGAGILGVTTAYRLAQNGTDVTVVDAGELGGGTSGATFSQVNASYAGYWDYFDLRRAGVDGYHRMAQEQGGAPWWYNVGTLNVYRTGDDFAAQDAHLIRLIELGYPAERIIEEATAVEPALARFSAERIYRFPGEGWVDAPAMVADIAERASQLGVVFRTGDAVKEVIMSGQDVTGVRLASGTTLTSDEVIVCAGRWTDEILALTGSNSRFVAQEAAAGTPVPGILVVTEPFGGSVGQVASVDDICYRPHGAGQTMVWSPTEDFQLLDFGGLDADADVAARLGRGLLDRAAEFVPALRSVSMQQAVVTARAMPADGLPIVGRPSGVNGVYVVLAHAAVTLAPALADLVVAEIIHERNDSALDRFRPDRLVSTDA